MILTNFPLIPFFRYGSSSGKLTYSKRFSDIDLFVLDYIHSFDLVHDLGASTGVTSMEFFKTISEAGKVVNFSFRINSYSFVTIPPLLVFTIQIIILLIVSSSVFWLIKMLALFFLLHVY